MHLGEHLQETYAIEVNRDVTDNLTTVKHLLNTATPRVCWDLPGD